MKAKILVYPTVDETTRIEYKNHVIQIYGYLSGGEVKMSHVIIDCNTGEDLVEKSCLLEAIKYIDKVTKEK